jgi:hypothetical protein
VLKYTMLMSAAALVMSATFAAADPAPAAPTQPAAAPAAAQADGDKVVCRTEPPATGSRLGTRRTCRTQREWDDIREQSQKETNKMEVNSPMGPRGN